jgi:filamentous hemagglutinin family protein
LIHFLRRAGLAVFGALLDVSAACNAFGGQVVIDKSFGHATALTGPNFAIDAALGRQVGTNLFQSFSSFNLDKGAVATFTAPAAVTSILARVTGGAASTIEGTIATRLDSKAGTPHPASFYLINPAGVVFGPDARLDVGGSFIVATADRIKLAGGGNYAAIPSPADAVLTTSVPAAFGFLAARPAAVTINGATLSVPAGKTILAAAGAVTISDSASLSAPAGQIAVIAVAAPATIGFSPLKPQPEHLIGAATGPVTLSDNAQVSADGNGGGSISVQCGNLSLASGAAIHANTLGSGAGRGIVVAAAGAVSVAGDTSGGDLAGIVAAVAGGATGSGGNIQINAASLIVTNGAGITTRTNGSGDGGSITARLSGPVTLSGAAAVATGSGVSFLDAGIYATTAGGGKAGSIRLTAAGLNVLDGAEVSSSTFGSGKGGNLSLEVSGNALLSGTQPDFAFDSGVFAASGTGASGDAGSIKLAARNMQVFDGAEVTSSAAGSGNGGNVTVKVARQLVMAGASAGGNDAGVFATSAGGSGNAGSLRVSAGNLTALNGAAINSSTNGFGRGGDVSVDVPGQTLLSGEDSKGFISGIFANSNSTGAGGAAGKIELRGGRLIVLGGARISSSTSGLGKGGDVRVAAAGEVLLAGTDPHGFSSEIGANSLSKAGQTSAGRISVRASRLRLLDHAGISASTEAGPAGDVFIGVNSLVLSGTAQIVGGSTGTGSGGRVVVDAAQSISLNQGSAIDTVSLGTGGNLNISSSGTLTLNNSSISAQALGSGGNLNLSAPQIIRVNHSNVAAGSVNANGGNIRIDPLELVLSRGGNINASGGRNGGNITILADAMPGAVLSGPVARRNVTATGLTGTSGSVAAGVFDAELAGSLILLSSPLVSEKGLAPQCGLLLGEDQSSFVINGRGGVPAEPGGWFPDFELGEHQISGAQQPRPGKP